MTLDDYLDATKETETAFGARVGISQPQVNRLRKNKSWPSRTLLARIFEATDGKVTPSDFVPGTARPPVPEASGAEAA